MTSIGGHRRRLAGLAVGAGMAAAVTPALAHAPQDMPDLSRLSLEELAQVEITSVSRRPEPVGRAAAAVYVIDAEDIRRSGATSLPEVLRLAPNLQVQRVNAGEYAISARGFNGYETANKLLVLIDGRSVYSTLHSGVFWDARNVPLEDIARIEVISGPGGALYGANAMNGVINIITRSAHETVGTRAQIGVGDEDQTFALRHGGRFGEAGAWRAYVTGFARDDSLRADGSDATDATSGVRVGFRTDWGVGRDRMMLQGAAFETEAARNEDFSGDPQDIRGGNLMGRWTRELGDGATVEATAYYDRYERTGFGATETNDTYDLLVQHAFAWGQRHQVVWGGGYRVVESAQYSPGAVARLEPSERTLNLLNIFVQDQIALREDLVLTVGAKFEENSFTGQEFLPSVRLAWRRPAGDLLWGAVSRATRTPNRIERDLIFPGFLEPADFQSELLTAFEVGYRANPTPRSSLSVSAFYNVYDDLRTVTIDPVNVFPLRFANGGEGETWGIEAWGSFDVTDRWRLSAGLSTLEKDFRVEAGALDISGLASVGADPEYQVLLHSQFDIRPDLELDLHLRAVDELVVTDAYVEADVRLGWRLNEQVELALVGRNLLEERHFETDDPQRRRAFGRSVYASVRVGF